MKVLLQWISRDHDPEDPRSVTEETKGPTLQLLDSADFRGQFDRAYLFTNDDSVSLAKANTMAKFLCAGEDYPDTKVVVLELDNVTDYGQLYEQMTGATRRIQQELASASPEFFIHISPGPPQAQTIWFVMAKAEDIVAKLLQTVRPEDQRRYRLPPVRPVSLEIDRFPVIQRLQEENVALRRVLGKTISLGNLRTRSPRMADLLKALRLAAEHSHLCVLLTGETGTGKELFAHITHQESARKDGPFLPVNCGAMPDELLESELFGYEKGAFTGATKRKLGQFELANHGTLFLDEIAELQPGHQVKLLRVLQDHKIRRLGGTEEIAVDVRVIAATNKDLKEEVRQGRFRKDLFYRVYRFPIPTVPLRERLEDLEMLCEDIQNAPTWRSPRVKLGPSAIRKLKEYRWPGNVRELENVLDKVAVCAEGRTVDGKLVEKAIEEASLDTGIPDAGTLRDAECERIITTLQECGGNQMRAAKKLGIHRNTLASKMKRLKAEGRLR